MQYAATFISILSVTFLSGCALSSPQHPLTGIRSASWGALEQEIRDDLARHERANSCEDPYTIGAVTLTVCHQPGRPQPILLREMRRRSNGLPLATVIDLNDLGGDPLQFTLTALRISPVDATVFFSIESNDNEREGTYLVSPRSASPVKVSHRAAVSLVIDSKIPAVGVEVTEDRATLVRYPNTGSSAEAIAIFPYENGESIGVRLSFDKRWYIVTSRNLNSSWTTAVSTAAPHIKWEIFARDSVLRSNIDIDGEAIFWMSGNASVGGSVLFSSRDHFDLQRTFILPQDALASDFRLTTEGLLILSHERWRDRAFAMSRDGALLNEFAPTDPPRHLTFLPDGGLPGLTPTIIAESPWGETSTMSYEGVGNVPTPDRAWDDPSMHFRELTAKSSDGALVPLSIIGTRSAFHAPQGILLSVYGAYGRRGGSLMTPGRRALLRRGILIGEAHVRGGGYLGPSWMLAGRGSGKRRALEDLRACIDLLNQNVHYGPIALYGRSAGAAVVARILADPEVDLAAAILDMPFLNIIETLSNDNSPLSVRDRIEWGDPFDPQERALLEEIDPMYTKFTDLPPPTIVLASNADITAPASSALQWVQHILGQVPDAPLSVFVTEEDSHEESRTQSSLLTKEARIAGFVIRTLEDHPSTAIMKTGTDHLRRGAN